MSKNKVGILGGSYNPIHWGHLKIAEHLLDNFDLEKCILMPTYISPFKGQDTADATPKDRLAMIKLALKEIPKDLGFELSTWEMEQKKISYTIDTAKHLVDEGFEPVFAMGADAFGGFAAWKSYREIFKYADIAVVSRPTHVDIPFEQLIPLTIKHFFKPVESKQKKVVAFQHESGKHLYFLPITPIIISSTELRLRIRQGQDVSNDIPESVLNYIYENKLYRNPCPPQE